MLYACERPHRADAAGQRALDELRIAVLVPVYNEDPAYLRAALTALAAQSRRPDAVHLVDDGSDDGYPAVEQWWTRHAAEAGIRTTWQRTPNQGKRHAQATALREADDADIIVTVDSDACLAADALGEVLQPFADPRVQGSAGLVVAANHRATLLTRVTDLYFVANQLVDRSALSPLGAVMVAPGSLAAYRAPVLRDNLAAYLGETFMGRPVHFSDDSLLTLFALLRGGWSSSPARSSSPPCPNAPVTICASTCAGCAAPRSARCGAPAISPHPSRLCRPVAALVPPTRVHRRPLLDGRPPSAPRHRLLPLAGHRPPAHRLRPGPALPHGQPLRRDPRPPDRHLAAHPLALLWAWTVLRAVRWYATLTCGRTRWGTRAGGPEVVLTAPVTA